MVGYIRLRARPARRIAGTLQGSFEKWLESLRDTWPSGPGIPGPGCRVEAGLAGIMPFGVVSGRFALYLLRKSDYPDGSGPRSHCCIRGLHLGIALPLPRAIADISDAGVSQW